MKLQRNLLPGLGVKAWEQQMNINSCYRGRNSLGAASNNNNIVPPVLFESNLLHSLQVASILNPYTERGAGCSATE
jgi:hypothetical protein